MRKLLKRVKNKNYWKNLRQLLPTENNKIRISKKCIKSLPFYHFSHNVLNRLSNRGNSLDHRGPASDSRLNSTSGIWRTLSTGWGWISPCLGAWECACSSLKGGRRKTEGAPRNSAHSTDRWRWRGPDGQDRHRFILYHTILYYIKHINYA